MESPLNHSITSDQISCLPFAQSTVIADDMTNFNFELKIRLPKLHKQPQENMFVLITPGLFVLIPHESRLIFFFSLLSSPRTSKHSIPQPNLHRLRLTIIRQRRLPQLPPNPTLLIPPKRQRMMQHIIIIHPHGPRPQFIADPDRRIQVCGVDGCSEAVSRCVTYADGIFLG